MKKLKYYGGAGYSINTPVEGRFEVKHSDNVAKFKNLADAASYYESLNEEKALWDCTSIPELLECHIWE